MLAGRGFGSTPKCVLPLFVLTFFWGYFLKLFGEHLKSKFIGGNMKVNAVNDNNYGNEKATLAGYISDLLVEISSWCLLS